MPESDATEDSAPPVSPAVERRIRIAVWGLASIAFLSATLALPWASADSRYLWLWKIEEGREVPYGGLALLALVLLLPLSVAAIAEAQRELSIFASTVGALALIAELVLYYSLARSEGPDAEPAFLMGMVATVMVAVVHIYTALTAAQWPASPRRWSPRPPEDPRSRIERLRHLGH